MIVVHDPRQGREELKGVSGVTKPTDVPTYSLFLELDTGDMYYFDGSTWKKVGWNAS